MKQATIVSVERPYLEIESDGEYSLKEVYSTSLKEETAFITV